jgi:hypothetical protein
VYFLQSHGFLAGASGAICGLLGALASWTILNRKYLPPHVFASWRNSLIINGILLAIISTFPGVSWAGHLGGAIFGLVAGALLTTNRFGPASLRWPALIGTVLLLIAPIVGLTPFARATGKWAPWLGDITSRAEADEINQFNEKVSQPVNAIIRQSDEELKDSNLARVLARGASRRDETDVEEAVGALKSAAKQLAKAAAIVKDANEYGNARVIEGQKALAEVVASRQRYVDRCLLALQEPDDEKDDDAIAKLKQRIKDADANWYKVATGG